MKVEKILNPYGINSFWHFTDRSNIESILRYGILSLNHIVNKDIQVSQYGASDSSHRQDIRKGLHKFVHLSFLKDHPMYHIAKRETRIINPVWIEIDLSVTIDNPTLYSNMLANTYNASIFNSDKLDEMIDFETMVHGKHFHTRKEARKAEVMVHGQINTSYIKGIYNGY